MFSILLHRMVTFPKYSAVIEDTHYCICKKMKVNNTRFLGSKKRKERNVPGMR